MPDLRKITDEEAAEMLENMALDLFAVQCVDVKGDTAIKAARLALLAYVMAMRSENPTETPERPF